MSFEKTYRACSAWSSRGFSAKGEGRMREEIVAGGLGHQGEGGRREVGHSNESWRKVLKDGYDRNKLYKCVKCQTINKVLL